jgi:chaperonin GroEL
MKQDNLYTGEEAREKLISGIRKVANAVGGTMGTGGSNAVIEAIENPGHLLTNDGFTIASSIQLADPIEEMGRKILLEAISRANKASGDGSSTTTVLTAAILEKGMDVMKNDGVSPMDIKRSLENCVQRIEDSVNSMKREITVDDVGRVAEISAEDQQIGNTIQEIYQQIGKDGIIYWDISKTTEDRYTIGTGITIEDSGFASPYMCDIDEKSGQLLNVARMKAPRVLLTKQKITTAGDFEGLFKSLDAKGVKEVVIFCDEFEPTIIPQLLQTRVVRGFKTLLVKMPTLWKDHWYIDVAKATGAIVIDPIAGLMHKDIKEEHLGKVGHIIVSKDQVHLDGIADLTDHIQALRDENTDDSILRSVRLNTKTARYFIGAQSDSALSYKRLKVEDAISAAHHALKNGVVAGGGVTLHNAIAALDWDLSVGACILRAALEEPFKQICQNASIEPDYEQLGENEGYDTRTKERVNMFDAGITDPANIVLNAFKNAVSVAASILTANTIVTFPREEQSLNVPQ